MTSWLTVDIIRDPNPLKKHCEFTFKIAYDYTTGNSAEFRRPQIQIQNIDCLEACALPNKTAYALSREQRRKLASCFSKELRQDEILYEQIKNSGLQQMYVEP